MKEERIGKGSKWWGVAWRKQTDQRRRNTTLGSFWKVKEQVSDNKKIHKQTDLGEEKTYFKKLKFTNEN